jgi:signal transduction histidine kinase
MSNSEQDSDDTFVNKLSDQISPTQPDRRKALTAPLRPIHEVNSPYLASRSQLISEVERQARELRLLHEMRTALVGVNDLAEIYLTAVESIATIFNFEFVSAYSLMDNTELRLQAQFGYVQFAETVTLNQGVTGRVAYSGKGILITDVKKYPDNIFASPEVTGAICVPLLGPGKEVLGTLSIESGPNRKLDERDYKLAVALAEHVTLAVAQALAHEREKRRLSQLALLNHVGRDLAAALEVDQIIERVTGPVRQSLNLYSVNIGLIDGDDLALIMGSTPATAGTRYLWPLETTNSLACHSARTGEMIVVSDVSVEPRFMPLPEIPNTKAEVIIPLRSSGQVIGVLDVISDGSKVFEDDDIILLKTLADQTSVALTNARRFSDLQRQSKELEETNQALAEANRLKSEFLSNVSHELRTPLNSVVGYMDMIQSGFYGDIPPEMNDPLERIYRNGRRLMGLINDVLDLANLETGRLRLMVEETSTSDLLEVLCLTGQTAAQDKGLEFAAKITPGAPRIIRTDVKRLQQIIDILMSNAVKFTSKGGVSVTIGAGAMGDMAQELSPEAFAISVSDTGIGIAEEEFEHVFEEFRQVDGSSTRQFGGAGLGLALARRLVRRLGGTISLNSKLNEGSIFTVTLPNQPQEQASI